VPPVKTAPGAAWCLDVGAAVQQRIQHADIITAGGPVQRGFRRSTKTWMSYAGVDVRPRRNQDGDGICAMGKVTGPVCHDMQQRPRHATTVNYSGCRKIGIVAEELP
jgi:hypothetical protein